MKTQIESQKFRRLVLLLLALVLSIYASVLLLPHPSDVLDQNALLESSIDISVAEAVISAFIAHVVDTQQYMVFVTTSLLVTNIGLVLIIGFVIVKLERQRSMLKAWRDRGFICERLEFLPDNRTIKLNSQEISLNKAQYDTLKLLADYRRRGNSLHALDVHGHLAPSKEPDTQQGQVRISRLRQELGSAIMERTFIRLRVNQGYWIDVDAKAIFGTAPELSQAVV